MVVGLSVWTSLGLHYKVGHYIRIVRILINILVVPFFVLWATTNLHRPGEQEGGAARI